MAKELKLYLPLILQDIAEYEALSIAETPITEDLEDKVNRIIDDSFLATMSEARLAEWERALGIVNTNNPLSQRRSVVLSRFRGTGKLNKTLIQAMVNAFTGGTAEVQFDEGVLTVRVAPPTESFLGFSIEAVTNELEKRKPAHLPLVVELAYITWGQIKDNFSSWNEVSETFESWYELSQYYIKQEGYRLWR